MASSFRIPVHFLILPMVLLSGCASTTRLGGDPQLTVYQGSELPAPDRADLTSGARGYYVGPFDKLRIDVFGIEELSDRAVQVSDKGRINFPPVGMIDVVGMTVDEVTEALTKGLRANYVRDPQVSVTVTDSISQTVTVEGDTARPGVFPITGRMTLLRTMALSGGTAELANVHNVVVFRTVKGQRFVALYDLAAVRQGMVPDPEIYGNDIVVVGRSQARRFFKDTATVLPLLTTPVLLLNSVIK